MSLLKIALCSVVMLPALSSAQTSRSREQDALKGPVRTVSVERVRLSNEDKARELNRKKLDIVSYDEKGRPNERDVYDDYGFFVGRELYQYGLTGLLSASTLSDVTGTRIERRVYGYDSDGNTISIRTYDAKGLLRLTQNYKYDFKRNLVEEMTRNSRGVIERGISKLDLNGASKEMVTYDGRGQLKEKWSYAYDGAGNLTDETLYNADGSLRKTLIHTYELDAHANWITRRTTVSLNSSGEPLYESSFVTYRTIKYY